MTNVDIRALANLARLEVTDEEVLTLESEIPSILGFVETIQKASVTSESGMPALRNVMRADESPIETGLFTEILVQAAPSQKDNRVVVKQVVSRKQK